MTLNYLQKNGKELETLIHTIRVYSHDIGMEFDIEKCAMLVRKSGKRHMTDGMELPNHDKIRTFGKNETYKCNIFTFDPAQKCYSKVMHRKEVTHSNGQ